jgi:hypothetical protein
LAAQVFHIGWLISAAVHEAPHRVQQLQPILQRGFLDRLPDVKTLFALEEFPIAPDVLRIDLEFLSVLGRALPTDFSFGHGKIWWWLVSMLVWQGRCLRNCRLLVS